MWNTPDEIQNVDFVFSNLFLLHNLFPGSKLLLLSFLLAIVSAGIDGVMK